VCIEEEGLRVVTTVTALYTGCVCMYVCVYVCVCAKVICVWCTVSGALRRRGHVF